MKPLKKKPQDDRLLKQLSMLDRKRQEELRRMILNDSLHKLV